MVRVLHLLAIVTTLAVCSGACTRNRASGMPLPELHPPEPPPRQIENYIDEPVPTIEPGPAETALNMLPVRPPTRPPVARPEPPKPEPPRIEPERTITPAPALTLKPAPGTEAKTEASIRSLLLRASKDLQNVRYAELDADGRAQYDTARRFMQQADEALKNGNLVFAGKLADKAATMASVLVR